MSLLHHLLENDTMWQISPPTGRKFGYDVILCHEMRCTCWSYFNEYVVDYQNIVLKYYLAGVGGEVPESLTVDPNP